jgi:GH25 family lysozyme M1 (1,4-beta-N-acetylmuramidase)
MLADNNVVGAIVKATQGIHHRDQRFVDHLTGADNADLVVGAYHWCDPTCDDQTQAQRFLDVIEDQPVRFIAAQVEQYWQSWDEWRRWKEGQIEHITQIVPPERISENGLNVVHYLYRSTPLPLLVYTRAAFIERYASAVETWLPDYGLWLANAPEQQEGKKITWKELKTQYLPNRSDIRLPFGCEQWTIWQFSRGRFQLPGTGEAKINLNLFNGSADQFYEFASVDPFTHYPIQDFNV